MFHPRGAYFLYLQSNIFPTELSWQVLIKGYTGWIQILVLTNCPAISTEIGTDSLKI